MAERAELLAKLHVTESAAGKQSYEGSGSSPYQENLAARVSQVDQEDHQSSPRNHRSGPSVDRPIHADTESGMLVPPASVRRGRRSTTTIPRVTAEIAIPGKVLTMSRSASS
jgi:hypothetical protein